MQQFKVGDHVIVDEGDPEHYLDTGLDGVVIYARGSVIIIEGYSTHFGRPSQQYVEGKVLIKVDNLVTHPERIYKTGDRVLVTGNTSKCTHYLTVGTDAEVISDEGFDNWRPELYRVRGLGTYGRTDVQWVHPDDLEAEPTYPRRSWWVDLPIYPASSAPIDFTLTPAAGWVLDEHGSTDRAVALREAVEVLGADTDIDELIDAAEWLLTGKVPA